MLTDENRKYASDAFNASLLDKLKELADPPASLRYLMKSSSNALSKEATEAVELTLDYLNRYKTQLKMGKRADQPNKRWVSNEDKLLEKFLEKLPEGAK